MEASAGAPRGVRKINALAPTPRAIANVQSHQPPDAVALARRLYVLRGLRSAAFGDELFGEPAWDMLLDLFVSGAEGRRLSVSAVCIGSRCSPATAHRYLIMLEQAGIAVRVPDETDHRRHFVRLTPRGEMVMQDVLERL